MNVELKPCACQATLSLIDYNRMAEYIKRLETRIGRTCETCIGCEITEGRPDHDCSSWILKQEPAHD